MKERKFEDSHYNRIVKKLFSQQHDLAINTLSYLDNNAVVVNVKPVSKEFYNLTNAPKCLQNKFQLNEQEYESLDEDIKPHLDQLFPIIEKIEQKLHRAEREELSVHPKSHAALLHLFNLGLLNREFISICKQYPSFAAKVMSIPGLRNKLPIEEQILPPSILSRIAGAGIGFLMGFKKALIYSKYLLYDFFIRGKTTPLIAGFFLLFAIIMLAVNGSLSWHNILYEALPAIWPFILAFVIVANVLKMAWGADLFNNKIESIAQLFVSPFTILAHWGLSIYTGYKLGYTLSLDERSSSLFNLSQQDYDSWQLPNEPIYYWLKASLFDDRTFETTLLLLEEFVTVAAVAASFEKTHGKVLKNINDLFQTEINTKPIITYQNPEEFKSSNALLYGRDHKKAIYGSMSANPIFKSNQKSLLSDSQEFEQNVTEPYSRLAPS